MDAHTLWALLDDLVMTAVCARLAVTAVRRLGRLRAAVQHRTVQHRTGNEVQP